MNAKFKELIGYFSNLFQSSKPVAPVVEASERSAAQEVDYLIKEQKSSLFIDYLNKGYVLTEPQFFNLCKDDFFKHICYDHVLEKSLISYVNTHHKETLKQLLNHDLHLITSLTNKKEPNINFKAFHKGVFSKKKVYVELFDINLAHIKTLHISMKYFSEYYNCSLSQFHENQKYLETTFEPMRKVNEDCRYQSVEPFYEAFNSLRYTHNAAYEDIVLRQVPDVGEFIQTTNVPDTTLASKVNALRQESSSFSTVLNNHIEKMKISDLPLFAQEVLADIQKLYQSIEKSNSFNEVVASIENKFFLKNSATQNIPQILQEYLALSPKTRARLKTDDGKTMDEMLTESLSEIKNKLGSIEEDIEHNNVKKFTATHKYLTAKS